MIIIFNNKLKIVITILFIIYLIAVPNQYGLKNHFVAIAGNICLILAVALTIFQINKFRSVVMIFIITFFIGQSIGYGLNIDFLKIYLSIDNGRGVSYSLASIVIPIIVAFLLSFIYKIFNKRTTEG
ncbi:hypothetical protein [Clostridium sp.]|uniref:hypothetical protein n=1 Tax=Clostridium sp. TaxID=1506 RepID=UPI00285252C5|nr:hypothetical protein [Clostridium sp.]